MEKSINNKEQFLYLGIGIFGLFIVFEIGNILDEIYRQILITFKTDSLLMEFFGVIINLFAFIILIYIGINWLINRKIVNKKKLFFTTIGLFIFLHVLWSIIDAYKAYYLLNNYKENYRFYIDPYQKSYWLGRALLISSYLKYLILTVILLKKTSSDD